MQHSQCIKLILDALILNDYKLYLPLQIERKRRQFLEKSIE